MGKTITVDDEVHKTLKVQSAKEGEDIKQLVRKMTEDEYGIVQ